MYHSKKYIISLLPLLLPLFSYSEQCTMGIVSPLQGETAKMNAVIEIKTMEEFNKYKGYSKPMIVKFYASWCGPCKELKEVYENLAKDYADIYFISINGDVAQSLLDAFNIDSYPTLLFFDKNGTLMFKRPGGISKGGLIDLLDRLKNGTLQKQEVSKPVVEKKPEAKRVVTPQKKEQPMPMKESQQPKRSSRRSMRQQQQRAKKETSRMSSQPKEMVHKGVRYVAVED